MSCSTPLDDNAAIGPMQHSSVKAAHACTDDGGLCGSSWDRPWHADVLARLWHSLGTYSQHMLCARDNTQHFLGRPGTPTQNSEPLAELVSWCLLRVRGVLAESVCESRQARVREAHGAVRAHLD
jgi:hypothetical protein